MLIIVIMFNTAKFRDEVANICIAHFSCLPKTGKPNDSEWTVLAAVVKYDSAQLEVVALGTGSKCIGQTFMSKDGDVLNDSHAEVVCRRAFLRYLYEQIELSDSNSIFTITDNSPAVFKSGVTFHFFTTHMPCGDSTIFPKEQPDDIGQCLQINCTNEESQTKYSTVKLHSEDMIEHENILQETKADVSFNRGRIDPCSIPKKRPRIDVFRTGAKCLGLSTLQDPKLEGVNYHTVGAIRTKPGRGDPTLSVSCSDKFAKWAAMGLQGALLSLLLESPVYISSITIAGNTPFSKDALMRAITTRFSYNVVFLSPFKHVVPEVGQADVSFMFEKTNDRSPCPSSIVWCNVRERPLEVSVDGRKQGVTKKNKFKKAGRLLICKRELFATFMRIAGKMPRFSDIIGDETVSYRELKRRSIEYYKMWDIIKVNVFKGWTVKEEDLLNFTVDVCI